MKYNVHSSYSKGKACTFLTNAFITFIKFCITKYLTEDMATLGSLD